MFVQERRDVGKAEGDVMVDVLDRQMVKIMVAKPGWPRLMWKGQQTPNEVLQV